MEITESKKVVLSHNNPGISLRHLYLQYLVEKQSNSRKKIKLSLKHFFYPLSQFNIAIDGSPIYLFEFNDLLTDMTSSLTPFYNSPALDPCGTVCDDPKCPSNSRVNWTQVTHDNPNLITSTFIFQIQDETRARFRKIVNPEFESFAYVKTRATIFLNLFINWMNNSALVGLRHSCEQCEEMDSNKRKIFYPLVSTDNRLYYVGRPEYLPEIQPLYSRKVPVQVPQVKIMDTLTADGFDSSRVAFRAETLSWVGHTTSGNCVEMTFPPLLAHVNFQTRDIQWRILMTQIGNQLGQDVVHIIMEYIFILRKKINPVLLNPDTRYTACELFHHPATVVNYSEPCIFAHINHDAEKRSPNSDWYSAPTITIDN